MSRSGPHLPWSDWSATRRHRFFRTAGIGAAAFILLLVVLVRCGGEETPVNTVGSTTTTSAPPATQPLATITAALHPNRLPGPTYQGPAAAVGETVLMMGGINEERLSTKKVWQFDPATGETKNIAALTTHTNNGASAAIGTDVFLWGGGARSSVFDTIEKVAVGANRESVVGKLPSPRTEAVAVTDPATGIVYLVGGVDDNGAAQLEVLATTDGVTFEVVTTLAEPVRRAAVALQGGSIWVVGGSWQDAPLASIQRVDLTARTAAVVAQMPQTLTNAMAFTLGDQVYVAGGRTPMGRSNEVRRLDPTTFTFSTVATLPANLSDAGVAVIGNTAYLMGGLGGEGDAPSDQIVTVTLG